MTHVWKVTLGLGEKTTKLHLPPCLRMDEVDDDHDGDLLLIMTLCWCWWWANKFIIVLICPRREVGSTYWVCLRRCQGYRWLLGDADCCCCDEDCCCIYLDFTSFFKILRSGVIVLLLSRWRTLCFWQGIPRSRWPLNSVFRKLIAHLTSQSPIPILDHKMSTL